MQEPNVLSTRRLGVNGATEWLTLDNAAAQLGITKSALYRWLQRGGVPHHRFGRLIRIHRSDFDRFVGSKRSEERWRPYDCLPTR